MAKGINKVILVATLGADPETRHGANGGTTITSVRAATNESWTDKSGQKQERTEWHRVKFFGKLAEIAGEYLRKGSQVYIEGSLRTEKYTDRDGVERFSTDIVANELQMLGGRQQGDSQGESAPRGQSRGQSSAPQGSGGQRHQYGSQASDNSHHDRSAASASAGYGTAKPDFPDDDDIPFF